MEGNCYDGPGIVLVGDQLLEYLVGCVVLRRIQRPEIGVSVLASPLQVAYVVGFVGSPSVAKCREQSPKLLLLRSRPQSARCHPGPDTSALGIELATRADADHNIATRIGVSRSEERV